MHQRTAGAGDSHSASGRDGAFTTDRADLQPPAGYHLAATDRMESGCVDATGNAGVGPCRRLVFSHDGEVVRPRPMRPFRGQVPRRKQPFSHRFLRTALENFECKVDALNRAGQTHGILMTACAAYPAERALALQTLYNPRRRTPVRPSNVATPGMTASRAVHCWQPTR